MIGSEKRTVFESIMSKDKYPSILSRQVEVIMECVVTPLKYFSQHALLNIGDNHSDIPQFKLRQPRDTLRPIVHEQKYLMDDKIHYNKVSIYRTL